MNISVIIPTYNYAAYIGRAIASVFNQTYRGGAIEVIVVDDGSTDDTAAVVAQWQQRHPGIHYHPQPNRGKAAAMQRGIALSSGDIIFTLDADDFFLPGKLAGTVAVLQQYPQVVHVASPARIEWADAHRPPVAEPIPARLTGRPINGTALLRYFYTRNQLFGGGSTFACRAAVAKAIPWHPGIDMYTDEWMVIQALLRGNSYLLPNPLSVWWVHGGNYSGGGGEPRPQKQARLRQSSSAVCNQLSAMQAPGWLLNAYRLKHDTRVLAWQEAAHAKTPAAVWEYTRRHLLSGQHSLAMLWHYRAFNRLCKGWR